MPYQTDNRTDRQTDKDGQGESETIVDRDRLRQTETNIQTERQRDRYTAPEGARTLYKITFFTVGKCWK